MSFESNMENYKDTMSSIMGGELAASAQRIAEGANLGEEARQATGQVIGPLALDMLREGIMAKSGISSALGKDAPTDFKGLVKAGLKEGLDHIKGKALDAAKASGIPTTVDDALTAGKNKLAGAIKGQTGIDVSDLASAANPVTAAMSKARTAVGDVQSQVSNLAEVATSANPVTAVTVAKGFAGRGGPQVAQGEEAGEEAGEELTAQDLIGVARNVIENPTPENTASVRDASADIFKTLTNPDSEPSSGGTVARQAVETEGSTLGGTFGTALGGIGAVGAAAAAASQQGLTGTQRGVAASKSLAVPLTETLLGDLVPGAAIATVGIEDFATPGGSLASKTEAFAEAGAGIKLQQYIVQGVNKLRGAGDAGEAGEAGLAGQTADFVPGIGGTVVAAPGAAGAGVSAGLAGQTADFVPGIGGTVVAAPVAETVAAAPVAETASAAAAAGAETGLFASAEAAAAAGPESGGAGFIVAGILNWRGISKYFCTPSYQSA